MNDQNAKKNKQNVRNFKYKQTKEAYIEQKELDHPRNQRNQTRRSAIQMTATDFQQVQTRIKIPNTYTTQGQDINSHF